MNKEELNDDHYLELMDRIMGQICNIEDHLESHCVTESYPEIRERIKKAIGLLADAYQRVGELAFKEDLDEVKNG